MRVAYIAHPLGAGADRAENLVQAQRWVMWAAEQGVAPQAPWIILASHWDESRREQGMAIDLATVAACDEVWLCGPRISAGMQAEAEHARKLGIPVRDFTGVELC